MPGWNPNLYLQFARERTQPAVDLMSRINLVEPKAIIDLGCGPGNSSEMLHRRWPRARVTGLDNSPEMIAAARKSHPALEWILADAAAWQSARLFDIVFSNAALHWLPRHEQLIPRLFEQVARGGALAFQIPSRIYSPSHQLILQVADQPEWASRMAAARSSVTMEHPEFYYDLLASRASALDMWQTEYYHVMDNAHAIVSWIKGAALRPYLGALATEDERERFLLQLTERVAAAYQPQRNGKLLFPFRRLFVVAYR